MVAPELDLLRRPQRGLPFIVLIAWILSALCASTIYAQQENNVWYFGGRAGITFNTAPPTALSDGALACDEGSACVADRTTGELQFYTDGMTVWNRKHVHMPNGTRLHGHNSATQSALIVPVPGSDDRYYLFTAGAGRYAPAAFHGIQCALVDMSLDSGYGDLTMRDSVLLDESTERLTAVPHANGRDYWVLAHGALDDQFYAWCATAAGIAPPVVSSAGQTLLNNSRASIGYLKASIDGRRLALANLDVQFVELFDFDNATGIVSNSITVFTSQNPYGVCFSPGGSKLYVSFEQRGASLINQYDLTAGSADDITASARDIVHAGDDYLSRWAALMLGPDGKIYCANVEATALGVIDRPDAAGDACSFRERGIELGDRKAYFGLPNMIEAFPRRRFYDTVSLPAEYNSICLHQWRGMTIGHYQYALEQNTPNPFRGTTTISFTLGLDADTRLEIYDLHGKSLAVLVNQPLDAGPYAVSWDAAQFDDGVYFYRLTSGTWSATRTLIIAR